MTRTGVPCLAACRNLQTEVHARARHPTLQPAYRIPLPASKAVRDPIRPGIDHTHAGRATNPAPPVLPDQHELARPTLRTHQVIADLIRHTTTHTGLTVHAVLDTDAYRLGLRYNKTQIDGFPTDAYLIPMVIGNYTIHPPSMPKPRPN